MSFQVTANLMLYAEGGFNDAKYDDYPQVASESAGDLFDATEIDELLTLRILTLSEAEKREIDSTDARTRQLLTRTTALSMDHMQRLHGTVRTIHPLPGAS